MLQPIPVSSIPETLTIPLFTERCAAGFPSPAADYTEEELDLNAYCIRRPSSTFFVRAIGDSMRDMGLHSGNLMVVDKAEKPLQGDIVIAETDGEFTVKRLQLIAPEWQMKRELLSPAYTTRWGELPVARLG
ncbi:peptidase [Salmonella enterica subsp. enterica serovar Infantis]|nr:peptidase [Salmonella enterica subsp. enterica serovar Infantis]